MVEYETRFELSNSKLVYEEDKISRWGWQLDIKIIGQIFRLAISHDSHESWFINIYREPFAESLPLNANGSNEDKINITYLNPLFSLR